MKRIRRIALSLVLAVSMLLVFVLPAAAANPTVSITVTAEVVSITNSQATWGIGTIATSATVYFSATGAEDVDYSTITNTGSVAVDIEIQGTVINGEGVYDWTWAVDPGDQIFSLYAYNVTSAGYDIPVKTADFVDIKVNLAPDGTYLWSMKFEGPTAFNALDPGDEKAATVTLVASKYVA